MICISIDETTFLLQYLATPESQSLRCDLIRFIVGVIHPTNELLCSDIIPRWAVIGWLLTTCTSSVAASNAKLALFYDWLFFEAEKDNIMNIGQYQFTCVLTDASHQYTVFLIDMYYQCNCILTDTCHQFAWFIETLHYLYMYNSCNCSGWSSWSRMFMAAVIASALLTQEIYCIYSSDHVHTSHLQYSFL